MNLFLREQAGYVAVSAIQSLFWLGTLVWFDRETVRANAGYLYFVSLLIPLLYLAYRYAADRAGYRVLRHAQDWNDADAACAFRGSSPLFRAVETGFANLRRLTTAEVQRAFEAQKEQFEFVQRFVHVMKTSLAALQLTLTDRNRPDRERAIQDEVDRLNYHLTMVLTLSRAPSLRDDLHIQPVALLPLVREAVNELRNLFIHRNIFPTLEIDADLTVLTDRKWLMFIVSQLLTNAVRYSQPGGRVRVSAERRAGAIDLKVEDEGIGIEPHDLPRVFDLYFTGSNGRRFGESTGIGLYLVRQIADQLRYDVSIHSTPGKGTTVAIRMPHSSPSAGPSSPAPAS